jgi:hypothetical protein
MNSAPQVLSKTGLIALILRGSFICLEFPRGVLRLLISLRSSPHLFGAGNMART